MALVCLFCMAMIVLVFLIDFIPLFNTWQSRIKIGQFTSDEQWKQNIVATSSSWLTKTPTIKLTDNSRLIIIDIIKGNYKRDAIQHWQQAALILGLTECYNKTKDEKIKAQLDAFVQKTFDNSGNWNKIPTEIDGVILAYAILNIDWISPEKYKPAFDATYKIITDLVGEDGTVAYKKHNTTFRFVDTIGFICPFLVTYGIMFQNEKAIDLGIKQITEFNQYGMFSNQFIPCHTYNVNTKLPIGLFGWGRGLGWYAIGLIDAWTALPENHSGKKILEESVIQFAKMAVSFQNKNGSWSWLIANPNAMKDSSTAATLSWFLSKASSIKEIEEMCLGATEKALHYIKSVTRRTGAIDFSQGDTKGIGIHSQEFDILPFTQGFVLRNLYL